ncbi:MAG: formylmethanofuran dehydrogenase subunit E family protein [Candidatus Omnitrophota bacterium]
MTRSFPRAELLQKAIDFHGHLGPYLVLGVLAGELALKKLKAKKYFGLTVKVWGATQKPKSCLIDGLQLSTGATYGKGNIEKVEAKKIKILIINKKTNHRLELVLKKFLIDQLDSLKEHKDSELFAKALFKTDLDSLFYSKF